MSFSHSLAYVDIYGNRFVLRSSTPRWRQNSFWASNVYCIIGNRIRILSRHIRSWYCVYPFGKVYFYSGNLPPRLSYLSKMYEILIRNNHTDSIGIPNFIYDPDEDLLMFVIINDQLETDQDFSTDEEYYITETEIITDFENESEIETDQEQTEDSTDEDYFL